MQNKKKKHLAKQAQNRKERLTEQLTELKKHRSQNNKGRKTSKTRTNVSLHYVKRNLVYEGKYRKKNALLEVENIPSPFNIAHKSN